MSDNEHESHHVNYLAVFFALCGFTALSVVCDVSFDSKAVTIVLVMAVAVAKALCVMMFFMHLKFEGNWKYILLAPTTILAIGLPLALMPDIGVAYYTSTSPQKGEWAAEMAEYRASDPHHEGEHADAEHAETEAADGEQGHDDANSNETDH